MKINSETVVCISLAQKAGNFGTIIYNHVFEKRNMNYLYKSFSTHDLQKAIQGAIALGIRGVSVTMPYKKEVLNYVDDMSDEVKELGAANTIVNDGGTLAAYNTDVDSSYEVLSRHQSRFNCVHILGNGGFSQAVQYSAKKLFPDVRVYTRKNWHKLDEISSGLVFNCTPVKDLQFGPGVEFIDCDTSSESGRELAVLQAARQFYLYTNTKFPTTYILENLDKLMEGIKK